MKFLIAISTLLVASVVAQHKTSYNGYKLVDISLKDLDQVKFLNSLEDVDPEFDIWNIVNKTSEIVATVMLSPRTQLEYMSLLRAKGAKINVVSNNVQDMIDYQDKTMELTNYKTSGRNIIQKYARYSEIINFVLDVVDENKDIASTYVAGQTVGNRDLRVIVFKTATSRRALWIDCGIHAREWVTPATCVYVINEIVKEYRANNPQTVALLNKYEIHILPVYNPDGYEFSHTTTRLWRKNRSTNVGSTCLGTDLNRNCDFRWLTGGSSTNPCSETYAGASGNSELETKAVTAALKAREGQWDAYISVHSYGDWWLLPWGHSPTDIPLTFDKLKANGDIGAAAIKAQFGEVFTVGSSSGLLYVTTGSSADWAFGAINVPYSYTLELRPGSGTPDYVYGFTLPEDRLPRVTVETWAGIKASLLDVSANLP